MDIRLSIVGIVMILAVLLGVVNFPSQEALDAAEASSNEQEMASGSTSNEMSTASMAQVSNQFELQSGDLTYPAHLFEPEEDGPHPAVVLLHSINGLDPGYITMSQILAEHGYVVLTVEWQTYERTPADAVSTQIVRDAYAFLSERDNVDRDKIGLTGFCIGGRYTMLMLPLIDEFAAGVAWYGFPYSGGQNDSSQPEAPVDVIDQLDQPILIIHGTADRPSPISRIYDYATALDEAGKYFELKVYQGEPHSFMLDGGELNESWVAQDAMMEMIDFFDRTLK